MQNVRRKDTAPELAVRQALHALGLRFRLTSKVIPGKPDIVLPRHKVIIQVHGCFWHGHVGCSKASIPVNNRDTWTKKIQANRERDARRQALIESLGWSVHTVWECEVRDSATLLKTLKRDLRRLGIPKVATAT
jgi:DNA mismatch endonuclease, patch repair protein